MSDTEDRPPISTWLDPSALTAVAIRGVRIVFGILGAIALIFGIVLLVWPVRTVIVLTFGLGLYLIIAGVVRLLSGIFGARLSGGHRAFDIVLGVLLIVGGVVAVRNASAAAASILILVVAVIGIGWIIDGVVSIIESRGSTASGTMVAYGILSLVAGIAVIVIPGWSAVWLLVFAGVSLVVIGAAGLVRAFTFGRSGAPVASASAGADTGSVGP